MCAQLHNNFYRAAPHLRGLLRHFADLHNLVFQQDFHIVPATIRSGCR